MPRGNFSRINDARQYLVDGGNDDMINDGGIGGWYDFLYDNFAGQVVRVAVTDARGRYLGDGEVYSIPADKAEFARAFGQPGGFRDILFSGSEGTAGTRNGCPSARSLW